MRKTCATPNIMECWEPLNSLYAQSKEGREFIDLMSLMLKRENILLAYRNIKANTGSKTAGTDKLTIGDIGKLSPDEVVQKVRYIVQGTEHGYRPKPVRRKDIPKPYDPTKTRPLGIPCIWGSTDTAMYQTDHGANMRSKVLGILIWFSA